MFHNQADAVNELNRVQELKVLFNKHKNMPVENLSCVEAWKRLRSCQKFHFLNVEESYVQEVGLTCSDFMFMFTCSVVKMCLFVTWCVTFVVRMKTWGATCRLCWRRASRLGCAETTCRLKTKTVLKRKVVCGDCVLFQKLSAVYL